MNAQKQWWEQESGDYSDLSLYREAGQVIDDAAFWQAVEDGKVLCQFTPRLHDPTPELHPYTLVGLERDEDYPDALYRAITEPMLGLHCQADDRLRIFWWGD